MRMRKKKNLSSRMQNVSDYIVLQESTTRFRLPESERYNILNLKEIFGNDNPVYLEIGCGKGTFITEMAKRNPNCNYIGVEVLENVIVMAGEMARNKNLTNVKFFNMGAELLQFFMADDTVSGIYLNFSCPYPKKQYENHRLTYVYFLNIYKKLMKKGANIYLKTDNNGFFEYSMGSLTENGFTLFDVTRDLYSSPYIEGNIATEYEQKFVAQGVKINRLVASLTL